MQSNMRMILHWFITATIGLAESLLVIRFVMRFFGANRASVFVEWVYQVTGTLLYPFRGIFPVTEIESRFIIEFSTLFAIFIYGLLLYFIEDIFNLFDRLRMSDERQ